MTDAPRDGATSTPGSSRSLDALVGLVRARTAPAPDETGFVFGATPGPRPSASSLADLAADVERRTDGGTTEVPRGAPTPDTSLAAAVPPTNDASALAGDAANVLVLGPRGCAGAHASCTRCVGPLDGDERNVLIVTFAPTAAERLAATRHLLADCGGPVAVVCVGGDGPAEFAAALDDAAVVTHVPDAADLRRLGLAISRRLAAWRATDRETVVCVDSVTDAVQFASDPKLVFRFLHVLHGRIRAANARAHYHLDPTVLDPRVVGTFTPLFDAVLAVDEDGARSVDT